MMFNQEIADRAMAGLKLDSDEMKAVISRLKSTISSTENASNNAKTIAAASLSASVGNARPIGTASVHNADMTNPSSEEMKHALQATQSDVSAIAEKLRADFAEHRGDMRIAIADMKTATETLRGDFHKATSENLKWIVITAIALAGATVSILTFVINNAAKVPQVQQPQQQQPVIVNVLPAASTPAAAQLPK